MLVNNQDFMLQKKKNINNYLSRYLPQFIKKNWYFVYILE